MSLENSLASVGKVQMVSSIPSFQQAFFQESNSILLPTTSINYDDLGLFLMSLLSQCAHIANDVKVAAR